MRGYAAILLILLFLAATILFIAYPELDLAVAGHMLQASGRFLLAGSRFFDYVHYATPYWVALCIGFFALAAIARRLGRPIGNLGAWQALYVAAVFFIGPGLLTNTLLKDHSGRPRPGDVLQFEGAEVYVAPFAFNGPCVANCSFVAGDPSAAFAFLAPALLLPARWRRWGVGVALGFGVLVGLLRMYQGGHFLSDVIFGALLSVATVLTLHWAMFDADGRPRLRSGLAARALGLVEPRPTG
jgi:lipid A 4'-phosphatase